MKYESIALGKETLGDSEASSIVKIFIFCRSSDLGKHTFGREGNEDLLAVFLGRTRIGNSKVPSAVEAKEGISHHRGARIFVPGHILIHFFYKRGG
jgi:hypothetical protein